MDLQLKGLNVLVTGGSSGIGASIVQEFLNEGCNVAFCSRSPEKINKLLTTLKNDNGVEIKSKALDIKNIDEFKHWLSELGNIDIFIPNASALSFNDTFKPNEGTLSANWEPLIETDLNANIKMIDAIVPYLKKSAYPAITYIGSISSSSAVPTMPAYAAIKIALTHYMKTLSKKLITYNIRVNTISPGDIYCANGFWDEVKNNRPENYKDSLSRNPMGRMGTTTEVAKVVTFISSPAASFVAGVNWLVDGNKTNHIQN